MEREIEREREREIKEGQNYRTVTTINGKTQKSSVDKER